MSDDNSNTPPRPPRVGSDGQSGSSGGNNNQASVSASNPAITHTKRPPVNLNYLQAPQRYKKGQDLLLFLRRFESYADAFGADDTTRKHWLINLLCDSTLQAIDRYLTPQITYEEVTSILKRVQGLTDQNREKFIQRLRKMKRDQGEDVREFFTRIYLLARKCYPDNENIRDHMVREVFVNHLQMPEVSARLREHPSHTIEEMLELAATLESCREANDLVASIGAVETLEEEPVDTQKDDVSNQLSTLISMFHTFMTLNDGYRGGYHGNGNQFNTRNRGSYQNLGPPTI